MNKIFVTILFLFLLNGCATRVNNFNKAKNEVFLPKKIVINNITINVDLAITKEAQETGLAGKSELVDNYGLLFLFNDKRVRNFWMKGMLVPIDIIWIADNKIVNITEKIPLTAVGQPNKLYSSGKPIDKVLEVKAGLAQQNKWSIGDKIKFLE